MKTAHSRLFSIYSKRHVKIISAPHILLSRRSPVRQQPTAPCIYLSSAHTSFELGAGSIFHPDGSTPQFFDAHDSAHSRNIDRIHSTCAAAAPSQTQKSLLLTLRREGTTWYQKYVGEGRNNLKEVKRIEFNISTCGSYSFLSFVLLFVNLCTLFFQYFCPVLVWVKNRFSRDLT